MSEDDKLVDTLNAYAERQLAEELGATLAQYTRVVEEKIAIGKERDEWADAIRSVAPGYIASPHSAKHAIQELRDMQLKAVKERDELFARLTDLSWEKMSPREQAVWAAAFAYMEIWSGPMESDRAWPAARSLTAADAAVKALREVLK